MALPYGALLFPGFQRDCDVSFQMLIRLAGCQAWLVISWGRGEGGGRPLTHATAHNMHGNSTSM